MSPHRVYKYDILADTIDDDKIEEFLSNKLFAKKIINPYANVGVIQEDDVVIQVQVVTKKKNSPYKPDDGIKLFPNMQLNDNTINELHEKISRLKIR